MTKQEKVKALWKRYTDFKENAEQSEFPQLFAWDLFLAPAYKDLMDNWNEEHANVFINGIENVVFKELGITL